MSLFDRMPARLCVTVKSVPVAAAFCAALLACPAARATATIIAATPSTGVLARGDAAASGAASSPLGGLNTVSTGASPVHAPAEGSATASSADAAESAESSAAFSGNTTLNTASDASAAASKGSAASASPSISASTSASASPTTFRNIVPLAWIEAQGGHAYDRAAAFAAQQDQLVPDSNPQAMRVHAILTRLIPFALKWNDRAKEWHWEIALIKSPNIEALSLPGGKFIIDTGMLDRLGLNDDETAILIGHLMAHALREHARGRIGESLQAIEQAQGIPVGITARGVEGNAVNIAPELLGMRYGADDETEGDVIGADITSRAGFDPRAGLAYWEKIDSISHWRSPPAFTAAHPISDKRLMDLKKRQKDMLALYAKAIGKPVGDLPPYRAGKWNTEERGR